MVGRIRFIWWLVGILSSGSQYFIHRSVFGGDACSHLLSLLHLKYVTLAEQSRLFRAYVLKYLGFTSHAYVKSRRYLHSLSVGFCYYFCKSSIRKVRNMILKSYFAFCGF